MKTTWVVCVAVATALAIAASTAAALDGAECGARCNSYKDCFAAGCPHCVGSEKMCTSSEG